MSNYLAIATATATLSQLIQAAIEVDVFGARVTTVRPDRASQGGTETKVNVYLYQVTPNTSLRNIDLPTRGADGMLIQRPRMALDLHYLLTFYGEELDLVPQRLLGSVVRTLHSRPLLTRRQIQDTINSGTYAYLAESDLADEVEMVKFTPIPLSLEELSKLWSVLFQTPYALSIAYQGSAVLIEGTEIPREAQPVLETRIYTFPMRLPVIESLEAQAGKDQLVVAESGILLHGKWLKGDHTVARVSGITVPLDQDVISSSLIPVTLPAGLRAGVNGVQVIQRFGMGRPQTEHDGVESNVLPFVLYPRIIRIDPFQRREEQDGTVSGTLSVQISPDAGSNQRVVLQLLTRTTENNVPVDMPAYLFVSEPYLDNKDTFSFAIDQVKAGTYSARVLVDGAGSELGEARIG